MQKLSDSGAALEQVNGTWDVFVSGRHLFLITAGGWDSEGILQTAILFTRMLQFEKFNYMTCSYSWRCSYPLSV